MRHTTLRNRLDEVIAEHGNYRAASAATGIPLGPLSRYANGKAMPREKALRALGLTSEGALFRRLTAEEQAPKKRTPRR